MPLNNTTDQIRGTEGTSGIDDEAIVGDRILRELVEESIFQSRLTNLYLSKISGEELTCEDLEDDDG